MTLTFSSRKPSVSTWPRLSSHSSSRPASGIYSPAGPELCLNDTVRPISPTDCRFQCVLLGRTQCIAGHSFPCSFIDSSNPEHPRCARLDAGQSALKGRGPPSVPERRLSRGRDGIRRPTPQRGGMVHADGGECCPKGTCGALSVQDKRLGLERRVRKGSPQEMALGRGPKDMRS